MTPPPLCIIQARYHSTRLPGKMLLEIGGETLIARAYRMAVAIFGDDHVFVTLPATDVAGPLGAELRRIDARTLAYHGDERDVLGRFVAAAHAKRWTPDSIIVRWTPDDPFKSEPHIRRVIAGERLPVELGCEAFTLAMLDAADARIGEASTAREHITHALFVSPPPQTLLRLTVDTEEDLLRARALATKPTPWWRRIFR